MLNALSDGFASLIKRPPLVSVLRLNGAIGAAGFGRGLTDAALAPLIARAFAPKRLVAVALSINSPGGSPAQSALIAARIRRLADEKSVPVFAFCEDVAASGGYWLATAGDEIYADANSILGSIGVIYAGFGFHTLLEKQGVERRVHTAGRSKSMLDPFRPEQADDVERIKRLQGVIHGNFIDQVRARRGAKLGEGDLFTGEIWVGREAEEIGLIDGIGHLVPTMKSRFGDNAKFNVIEPRRNLFRRLGAPGVEEALGSAAGLIEERALFARYGL
ncbi:S49 family peptidase [Pikeienuella piscinae]|uniref:S49 family peptidase n=1 Tax=Pikeienuella piscinae TaxID=2748098 RepID=A0A7L5BWR1_9RHOB|nr:S49 family peptidase [Pikeienuella piscinae]QIE55583.1 S49 family peptidase [Pikeienuella piscinae]